MSDFLYAARRRQPGELAAILEAWLGGTARCGERHGAWGSLAVARAAHDDPPILQDRAADDRAAAGAAGSNEVTGLVDRPRIRGTLPSLLDQADPVDWSHHLDGPFALLHLQDGGGRIVTDLFSWVPVYAAPARPGPGGRSGGDASAGAARLDVLGTHADAVAVAAGVEGAVDPVSTAEFLAFQRITWPHTLYRDVRQLPPAWDGAFDASGAWRGAGRSYWEPRENRPFGDIREAAAELRRALTDDVAAACAAHDRVGLLLSGGEDGRVVLGAVPTRVEVAGFTVAPFENREVRSARRVARAYGASVRYTPATGPDVLEHFDTLAALAGTQHEALDIHLYPHHEILGLPTLPVVLGGFSSDILIKGDRITRAARRHGPGFAGPMDAPSLAGLRTDVAEEVRTRRETHLQRVLELRPDSGHEWSRIWPFSMRAYSGHFHGNRRLFRSHEPFHANDVARLAAAVPQAWKLNRRLFNAAFRPLMAPSWYVPHTRNRIPYFGDLTNRLVRGPLGLGRRVRDLLAGQRGANQESWPTAAELAASQAVTRSFERHPPLQSPLAMALEPLDSPAALDALRRTWPATAQLALLQLAVLLNAPHRIGVPGSGPRSGATT